MHAGVSRTYGEVHTPGQRGGRFAGIMKAATVSRRVRSRRAFVALLVLVAAVVTGIVVQQSFGGTSSAAEIGRVLGLDDGVTVEDGLIPNGAQVSVFDDTSPAVTNLSADLLGAVREAATDARADGVEFVVNSGWRSAALQAQLLREAVTTYGSEAEAARWVATPENSSHVTGDAIDLGPLSAQDWLAQHGAAYGLCQTYANERWHYELRAEAITAGCPQMYMDPTEDPRMW